MSTSANTSSPTSPSPDPDPSSPVISFANNNIRDRRPFHPGRTGISSHRPVSLCHIFEAANLSLSISMSKPLTALSLQYLTIPLQHSSVTSKESLCKHTKALFSKFLFKFAYKTASSFISSWVFGWNIKVWDRDAELRQQMQSVHLRITSHVCFQPSPRPQGPHDVGGDLLGGGHGGARDEVHAAAELARILQLHHARAHLHCLRTHGTQSVCKGWQR